MTPPASIPDWLTETETGIVIRVQLMARASRERICGVDGADLLVSLNVDWNDDRANQVLVKFLADQLGVARAQVNIVAGGSGKSKRASVEALRPTIALMRLSPK